MRVLVLTAEPPAAVHREDSHTCDATINGLSDWRSLHDVIHRHESQWGHQEYGAWCRIVSYRVVRAGA
jgi:hypothetical protein